MFTAIPIVLLSLLALTSAGTLSGNDIISVENYPDIGSNSPDSPPFCGMSWDSLDLSLITAVQGLTTDQCGTCLLVCGVEPNACAYILAVDQGGRNLDLSTGISGHVIGTTDGVAWAEWEPVADEYCSHIYQSGDHYGEPPSPDSEGDATPFPMSLNPTITSFTPTTFGTSVSVTADYIALAPAASTSVLPISLISNPIISSSISFSSATVSDATTLVLSPPANSLTSTSSSPAVIQSSIAYTRPQLSNSTNALNSSSSLSGNDTSYGCSTYPNSTVTYNVSNADYKSTSGYDLPVYTKAVHNIRGLRWFR